MQSYKITISRWANQIRPSPVSNRLTPRAKRRDKETNGPKLRQMEYLFNIYLIPDNLLDLNSLAFNQEYRNLIGYA